jgi:nitrogen fixation-related uncharacterized protein
MKKGIIVIVVIVLAVLGYYWYVNQSGQNGDEMNATTSIAISDEF